MSGSGRAELLASDSSEPVCDEKSLIEEEIEAPKDVEERVESLESVEVDEKVRPSGCSSGVELGRFPLRTDGPTDLMRQS